MMNEKRFVIDEEGISDNKTAKWYCWKEEVVDLLNEQEATIQSLKEENEQLRHEIEIEKKWQLEKDKYYVKIKEENEQLKQEHKIAIDEMLTDYKKLEEENEQLRKENFFLAYWKRKAMILLMQVRRLTPRMTDKEVIEFSKELDDE